MSPHLIERVTRLSLLAYFAVMAVLVCAAAAWVLKAAWLTVGEFWAKTGGEAGDLSEAYFVAVAWFAAFGAILTSVRELVKRRLRGANQSPRRPCPACGYDLRATPSRCPECGRPPWHRH